MQNRYVTMCNFLCSADGHFTVFIIMSASFVQHLVHIYCVDVTIILSFSFHLATGILDLTLLIHDRRTDELK